MNHERVAVIGASAKPDRYSYKAIDLLAQYDHTPVPVSVRDAEILGHTAYPSAEKIEGKIDTVTLYVNPRILSTMVEEIAALNPARVIMNPGTESAEARAFFEQRGIRVIEACTLVLLKTNQFMSV
jgi:uncharacterized protein